MPTFVLINTMQKTDHSVGRPISQHRSILAAVLADRKFQRAVRKHNGQSSYIPTAAYERMADGTLRSVDQDTMIDFEAEADRQEGR